MRLSTRERAVEQAAVDNLAESGSRPINDTLFEVLPAQEVLVERMLCSSLPRGEAPSLNRVTDARALLASEDRQALEADPDEDG